MKEDSKILIKHYQVLYGLMVSRGKMLSVLLGLDIMFLTIALLTNLFWSSVFMFIAGFIIFILLFNTYINVKYYESVLKSFE